MPLTPAEIVAKLDRYIVGQEAAKRAVAVAVRNRWRRRQLPAAFAREVNPRNIIMMGPTGCGKTEIARRLAALTGSPFIKVEATKFTEVGYHGRDVDAMVRDLLDQAILLVKREFSDTVRDKARRDARDRVLEILLPSGSRPVFVADPEAEAATVQMRENLARQLDAGQLDDKPLEISTTEKADVGQLLSGMGLDQFGPDMAGAFERMMPARQKRRKTTVAGALRVFTDEAIEAFLDQDAVLAEALRRTEEDGIIFIDEIDKIAMPSDKGGGPDVSRSGVQRDLLPIVEGCVVNSRHGPIKTDHILFIAAGAFHVAKPSDLMPELQGRFPIRVELEALTRDDFVRILTEKEGALPLQQQALLKAEGMELTFDRDALEAIADMAWKANNEKENIGARRLMTIVEKVFELLNFDADQMVLRGETRFNITERYVRERMDPGAAGRKGWFRL